MFAESLKVITANVRASRENAQNIAYEKFLVDNKELLHRIEIFMQSDAERGEDSTTIRMAGSSWEQLEKLKRFPCPESFIFRYFKENGFDVIIRNDELTIAWPDIPF